jgi:heme-degrading monooxygenase HmoA
VGHLAQLNIARALAPLDSDLLAPFVAALDEINALADAAPGFRWRLEDGESDLPGAIGIQAFDDPQVIVNLSVWDSREALWDFVYSGDHLAVMRRRREWFGALGELHLVLWWVEPGTEPSIEESIARLEHLRAHGPTPHAFTFKESFVGR